MGKKLRVACIIGTRPEVIKMAPVIVALKSSGFDVVVVNTAQHRQLLDDMLKMFNIVPDIDMNIMQENQSLATLTGNLFIKMEEIFNRMQFDCVIAQGDTTTTLVAAQVAFYHKIPFGHVEAGLRSYNMYQPFPEEMNRVFVSKIATWHFAPTEQEKENLLAEGISATNIAVTGNTVIDSLYESISRDTPIPYPLPENKRVILVTLHRRESFGEPIRNIFSALIELTNKFNDIEIMYPVHPNPNVQLIAKEMLADRPGIQLLPPLSYDVFVSLMKRSTLIMSDSGGLQEEAPALNKPILVLREVTERPLIIELGLGLLVGSDKQKIIESATKLLTDPAEYQAMQRNLSPYGDGHAAGRIVNMLQTSL